MIKDSEGNFVWKPSIKQDRFLSIPLSVKEAFYAGALMAGKSEVLIMYPIYHGWHKHPHFKGLFLRRTMPELRHEIIPRAKQYLYKFGAKYNASDGVFTFPSGALYFMGHCEHEDDVHKYDSMQPNYVAFDELTSFTEWIYEYITVQRVRVPEHLKHELPMIVRSASNPGNIGHQFVYKRFIKPEPNGGKILVGRGGIKRIFIPATIDDNPYASEQYKKELDSLPEAERKAKKYGDWNAYEGAVFDEFRDKKFPSEPENAIHVIEPIDIPNWWPKIVSCDWGYASPAATVMLFGAISPTKRLYIYRELTWQKTLIERWGSEAKVYIDEEQPRVIKLCKSAGQSRGQDHTIHEQVESVLGRAVELTDNSHGSRVAGKMMVHEYLRWLPKHVPEKDLPVYNQELAEWILRNKSPEDYQSYLRSLQPPEPEGNLPKLQIFKTCEHLIHAIKTCFYDKTHPQDVAEFPGDDSYDALRYICDAADKYFDDSIDEMKRIRRRDDIDKMLANTNDFTAYYRNMRKNEAELSEIYRPIRRYHGGARR